MPTRLKYTNIAVWVNLVGVVCFKIYSEKTGKNFRNSIPVMDEQSIIMYKFVRTELSVRESDSHL